MSLRIKITLACLRCGERKVVTGKFIHGGIEPDEQSVEEQFARPAGCGHIVYTGDDSHEVLAWTDADDGEY